MGRHGRGHECRGGHNGRWLVAKSGGRRPGRPTTGHVLRLPRLSTYFTLSSPRRRRFVEEEKKGLQRLAALQRHGASVLWHVATSEVTLRVLEHAVHAVRESSSESGGDAASTAKPATYCSKGLRAKYSPICCAASCGQCGQDGCTKRPGGFALCCREGIMGANVTCTSPVHTACVLPK